MWINIGNFSRDCEKFCLLNNSNITNCIRILSPNPRGEMNMEKYCPRPSGPSNVFQLRLLRWLFWGGMTQALRAVGDVGCWRHWSAIVATHCAMCHRRYAHAPFTLYKASSFLSQSLQILSTKNHLLRLAKRSSIKRIILHQPTPSKGGLAWSSDQSWFPPPAFLSR